MSNTFRFDAKRGRLRITGELTIYQAAAAKAELLKALDSGKLREIDLGVPTWGPNTGRADLQYRPQ